MNVCIVGLGLIGGTYAHGLKNSGKHYNVTGIDINKEAVNYGIDNGIISNGNKSDDELLSEADIIIITIYPTLIKKFLQDNKNKFKEGAIITDAAGVKGRLYKEIKEIKLEKIDFILGHPMAGREKIGIENSDPNIFLGANYILTPVDENKKDNIEKLEKLIYSIGFSKISYTTPEEHDEIIAFTSQLTHVIAVALVNSDTEKFKIENFIGDSYRDLTRIAKINTKLWSELFIENKENLIEKIDEFQEKINNIKEALVNNNVKKLESYLIESGKRRGKIDGSTNKDKNQRFNKVKRVGFQGVKGSFGYFAMKKYFKELEEYQGYETFEEVFENIENGKIDYGVLPYDNSTTGAIKDNYNLLRERKAYIVGEIYLPVRHNILGIPGSKLDEITDLFSHPQGFEQSSQYLKERNYRLIPHKNTALSASYVAESKNKKWGAIASIEAGALYGLVPLVYDINHNKNNMTRFIIISRKLEIEKNSNKISLVMSAEHKPGALVNILTSISDKGVNMVNIGSFPILEKPWEYFFYIDLNGSLYDRNIQDLITDLEIKSSFLKVLGNY